MAIKISQPFQRTSSNPIDETLTLTKAQMLTVNDNLMPNKYFTICQDDGFIYIYDKSNPADPETGKFLKLEAINGKTPHIGDNGNWWIDDEDWIIYNLAEYWRTSQTNNTGKFKARVVRKESGSIIEGYVSGCTHFMMVAMSLNINNSTINYNVKGAIPLVYECEGETGLFVGNSRYKNLVLDTDYTYNSETGEYTSVGTPLGSWTGAYLVLFANTDYGMANVRVAI
jgi:hypothetical protein